MSARAHAYHNRAQERVLRLLGLLAGHEATGLPAVSLARSLGASQSSVHKDLWNLQHVGFAEQLDSGHWRLGPKPVQIALAFQRGLAAVKATVEEIENRYTREPK